MKNLLLLFIFVISSFSLQAKTIFVKKGGNGDGSSWATALGSLQAALKVAVSEDQIWVAKGKYFPTTKSNRNASFNIPSDVAVYGGFVGTEFALSERNFTSNETILSGEIGSSSINDNSYSVVYTKGVSAATIIDGFTIQGGAANGNTKGSAQVCGGAWFNDATQSTSSPTISNCIFRKNIAREGAALYNQAQNGEGLPTITACTFIDNKADLDGGAIFNNGYSGTASPVITDCKFINNEATYGGAILNQSSYQGKSTPIISNCSFTDNLAYIRGGSVHDIQEGGKCKSAITGCSFVRNNSIIDSPETDLNNQNKIRKGKSTVTFTVK